MKIQVDLPPKGPLLTKRDYDAKLSPFDRMIAAGEKLKPTYTFVKFGEVMQECDEYWSSTLGDWTTIESELTGRQMANKGCVMRRKVK